MKPFDAGAGDTMPSTCEMESVPEMLERRPQAARRRESRTGTAIGTGLSIAKAIVEGHGRSIGVDSVPGRGSRFPFSLPVTPNTIVVSPSPPDGGAKNHAIV